MTFTCARFDPVQLGIDARELLPIAREEIGTPAALRDSPERFGIEFFLAHRGGVADGDGVDADAAFLRDACRLSGRHLAGGVVPIRSAR